MILSDTGSGLCTAAIAMLLWLGNLEVWHIYLAMVVSSTCQGFQCPAYYSAWNYLLERPGLMMFLLFFVVTNFTIGLVQVLITSVEFL